MLVYWSARGENSKKQLRQTPPVRIQMGHGVLNRNWNRTRWNTFSPPHVITSLSIRQEVKVSSNHCPWCIGKTQDESELLLAGGALLHLITWLWIYHKYMLCILPAVFEEYHDQIYHTHVPWILPLHIHVEVSSICDAFPPTLLLMLDVYLPALLGKYVGTCGNICDCGKVQASANHLI